jgi:hypothetical protein
LIGIKITCFLSLLVLDIVVNAGTVINCPIKNKWMLAPKKTQKTNGCNENL